MNRNSRTGIVLRGSILALAAGLLGAVALPAQVPFAGGTLSGVIDAGGRAFTDEPTALEWARFGEYRNLNDGAYLPNAKLRFNSQDRTFLDLVAFDAGRSDQKFALLAYQPGKYSLDLSWSQIPHLYSTSSYLYGGEPSQRGVFSLPNPRPTAAEFNANSPVLSAVSSRWDVGRVVFKAQPTETWNLKVDYNRTRKQGDRPIGMSFSSPGGNHREILEPIGQVTHSLNLSQGFSKSNYQVELGYGLSVFQNEFDRLVADNPGSAVNVVGGNQAAGALGLAPDNLAHTFSFLGSVRDLPLRTRITGTVNYAWWLQDQVLQPYTINPTITVGAPASTTDGRTTLAGDQRSINAQISASSRPVKDVTLSARYRRHEFQDKTADFILPLEVVSDRTLTNGPFEREHHAFSRDIARFEAGWRSTLPVAFRVSWDWNSWTRGHARDVPKAQEHAPRAVLDLDLTGTMGLRAAYTRSWRRADAYRRPVEADGITPNTAAVAQNPDMRRFDQSDRDRDRVDLSAQLAPVPQVGLAVTYTFARNKYAAGSNPAVVYGVEKENNNLIAGDATITPNDRISFNAGVGYEWLQMVQRSRYREPTALANLTFDWMADSKDKILTAGAGFQATVLPEKLELGGQWNFYDARTEFVNTNPNGTPTGGTASQNANATVADWPTVLRKMHRLDGSLRYRLAVNWSATVSYAYEWFRDTDFRTDGLVPAPVPPAAQGDLFLGSDVWGYGASYIALTLGYNIGMSPGALRLGR